MQNLSRQILVKDSGSKVKIKSGKLLVVDPCWSEPKKEMIKGNSIFGPPLIKGVKNGNWTPWHVLVHNFGRWGTRVMVLGLTHTSLDSRLKKDWIYDQSKWKKVNSSVGVDCGVAGIYDFDQFPDNQDQRDSLSQLNNQFYQKVAYGVTSRSGVGDGMYSVYTHTKNNQVLGVKIIFVSPSHPTYFYPTSA